MTARPSSNESLGLLVPGGGRNLDQLKQEVQRRADRNLPPLGGIAPEDARAALLQIKSLEREFAAQDAPFSGGRFVVKIVATIR